MTCGRSHAKNVLFFILIVEENRHFYILTNIIKPIILSGISVAIQVIKGNLNLKNLKFKYFSPKIFITIRIINKQIADV